MGIYTSKLFSLAFILFLFTDMYAQQAVSASGGEATGRGGTVSYTIGQVVYTSICSTTGIINQGVQQPYEIKVTGIRTNKIIVLSVYPNPTVSAITLKVKDFCLSDDLSYLLYDDKGSLIIKEKIVEATTNIPMFYLAAAPYILKVADNKYDELKTFRIIKN